MFWKQKNLNFLKKSWVKVIYTSLVVIILANLISLFMSKISFLDMFNPSTSEVYFTDVYYSNGFSIEPEPDTNIVIINIGVLGRKELANLFQIIKKQEPRVIGIAAIFRNRRVDSTDLLLKESLELFERKVQYLSITFEGPDLIATSHEYFMSNSSIGYTNLIVDEVGDFGSVRYFISKEKVGNQTYLPFAAEVVRQYSMDAFEKYVSRNNEIEIIHYTGFPLNRAQPNPDNLLLKVFTPKFKNLSPRFNYIDWKEIFDEKFTISEFKNKIVLFGFIGSTLGDQRSFEDKYFTPLNPYQ